MKPVSVIEGIGLAVIASVLGAGSFSLLAGLFGAGLMLQMMIALLAMGYVSYLLIRSSERQGRFAIFGLWAVAALSNFILSPGWALYLVVHMLLIWLVRVLYHYHSFIPAMLDLALHALSLLLALWAWNISHSLLLSLWSFFLCQALFVLIPKQLSGSRPTSVEPLSVDSERFGRAYQAAEMAVRKLIKNRQL